ncbi:MAG TPA: hypothetical protein VK761_05265 [Solirubrobacteraceae bacterium]|nr:hypothetical protein [Solirubrobacteraceae bacterium]
MRTRDIATTLDPSKADVLDLMASRTKRNHPDEALHPYGLVVLPHLMALHRMFATAPAANLTAMPSILISL